MDKIHVLLLSERNLQNEYEISERADWKLNDISVLSEGRTDVAVIDRDVSEEEAGLITDNLRAYCLFVTERAASLNSVRITELLEKKMGKVLLSTEIERFLKDEITDYYSVSYGEKYSPSAVCVKDGFDGKVSWTGFEAVTLEGDFGNTMNQAVYWRNTIPVEKGQHIDFWLEYIKDPGVEIELEITGFIPGTVSDVCRVWRFSEQELDDIVYIGSEEKALKVFVSLKAKGYGKLSVRGLHDRYSRRGKGYFLPGGQRAVTSDREEVFWYYDPGNMKPPLNVYFSGYKTREGFEGYNMMRKTGHPFLLIAEARLEGGAFYMGSEEYESIIEKVIRVSLKRLGFTEKQLVLSGLSMGTFGALYYGCRLRPHTVLLGKPLASLGDVAANERILRPGGFPTSIDVLHKMCGSTDSEAADRLNRRFWDEFDRADWSETRFAVSYMIEDDYDRKGYEKLLEHLSGTDAQVTGKGIHGRHNDDTYAVVNWFISRFKKILSDGFEYEE